MGVADSAPVLVIMDYQPGLAGEMEAVSGPLLDQLVRLHNPYLTFVATTPGGNALVERLLARGDTVTVIDDLSTGSLENLAAVARHPRLSMRQSRVSECADLGQLVKETDSIFHLAAAVGVDLVVRSPIHVIVPGLFSDCFDTQSVPYGDGITRTRERSLIEAYRQYDDLGLLGIRSVALPGRTASSENGLLVADAIRREAARPGVRQIVLVAYSRGILSSRAIERACRENVVFQALSADSRPHFTTIAEFVRAMGSEIRGIFVQVLTVCSHEGLISLRNPDHAEHGFRSMPNGDSDGMANADSGPMPNDFGSPAGIRVRHPGFGVRLAGFCVRQAPESIGTSGK